MREGRLRQKGMPLRSWQGREGPNQGNQHLVLPLTTVGSGNTTSPCCLGDRDLSRRHTLLGNPSGLGQGHRATLIFNTCY